jgi:DNA-binding NtrC family response regulator
MQHAVQHGIEPEISRTSGRKVLAVDDEPEILSIIDRALSRMGIEVDTFTSGEEALQTLEQDSASYESVLFDLHMPDIGALEVLERAKRGAWNVPIVVVTGQATVSTAVEAMRLGAFDLLTKPFAPLDRLVETTCRAIERAAALRRGRLAVDHHAGPAYAGLIGGSSAMREVFALVEAVAPTNATVLIQGETGTGKELVARAIHARSLCVEGPFHAVRCGDVIATSAGIRELLLKASGGTLFLDELSELDAEAQSQLVRALQNRDETDAVNAGGHVRVVGATNHDLAQSVRAGTVREDRYYRLRVFSVELPPLRERLDDLPLLVEHFAAKHASRLSRSVPEIREDALTRAATVAWPGNVRELENAVERVVILGGPVTAESLIAAEQGGAARSSRAPAGDVPPLAAAKRAFERDYLTSLLMRSKGNRAVASRLAGLDPSNLRRLLRRHGLS